MLDSDRSHGFDSSYRVTFTTLESLENRLDHFVPDLSCLWELWRKVARYRLELLTVAFKVAKADSLTPVLEQLAWHT